MPFFIAILHVLIFYFGAGSMRSLAARKLRVLLRIISLVFARLVNVRSVASYRIVFLIGLSLPSCVVCYLSRQFNCWFLMVSLLKSISRSTQGRLNFLLVWMPWPCLSSAAKSLISSILGCTLAALNFLLKRAFEPWCWYFSPQLFSVWMFSLRCWWLIDLRLRFCYP